MRVISISTLVAFWERPEFKDAEVPLRAWLKEVRSANWRQPSDIKAQFGNASILNRPLKKALRKIAHETRPLKTAYKRLF
jgi:mRNA-degrading endonuclease HigB of HigAB toxin-antitoxin module